MTRTCVGVGVALLVVVLDDACVVVELLDVAAGDDVVVVAPADVGVEDVEGAAEVVLLIVLDDGWEDVALEVDTPVEVVVGCPEIELLEVVVVKTAADDLVVEELVAFVVDELTAFVVDELIAFVVDGGL